MIKRIKTRYTYFVFFIAKYDWTLMVVISLWRSNPFWHSTSLSRGSRWGPVVDSEVRCESADSVPSTDVVRAAAWSRRPSCCDHWPCACSPTASSSARPWTAPSSQSCLLLQSHATRTWRVLLSCKVFNLLDSKGSYSATYEVGTLAVDGWAVAFGRARTGRAAAPPWPLLALPNVTAHPSTASVPITVLLYDGPLLCGFTVAIKGLNLVEVA